MSKIKEQLNAAISLASTELERMLNQEQLTPVQASIVKANRYYLNEQLDALNARIFKLTEELELEKAKCNLLQALHNKEVSKRDEEKVRVYPNTRRHIVFWTRDGILNFRVSDGTQGSQPLTYQWDEIVDEGKQATQLMETYKCTTQEWI